MDKEEALGITGYCPIRGRMGAPPSPLCAGCKFGEQEDEEGEESFRGARGAAAVAGQH